MKRFVALTMTLVACSKGGPPPVAPSSSTAPVSSSAPAPTNTQLAGDGFFLDVPKWKRTSDSEPKGLTAKYTWGAGAARTTRASDGGAYFRLTFPDRPGAADVARLELHYEFALSAADRGAIRQVLDAVVAKATDIVAAAAQSDKVGTLADRVAATSADIVAAAKPLDTFTAADGSEGSGVVLRALGFRKRDDGSWAHADTNVLISLAAADATSNGAAKNGEALKALAALPVAPTPATACSTAVDATKSDATKGGAARSACANAVDAALVQRVKTAQAARDAKPAPPSAQADLQAATALEGHAKGLVDASEKGGPEPDHVGKEDLVALSGDVAIRDSYEYRAYRYARAVIRAADAEAQSTGARGKLTGDLQSRVEVLERDEPGSVILQAGGEKRMYDVSTGVVYVAGLDDVVMPVLLAVCLANGGCLTKGERFDDSSQNFFRSLSIDAGVRAQTLDKPDPRARDALAFLAGASWNPLYFLRVSGGAYNFENAQSSRWNMAAYGGVTVNVLQAVELLGVVGLGSPQAPKIVGK